MTDDVRLYRAAKILTLDPRRPAATHVAVAGDRILAVGDDELEREHGPASGLFDGLVVVPGFVEGHAHATEGMVWRLPYVGFHDRAQPDGEVVAGCRSTAALLDRLRQLERGLEDGDQPLFAWGYDSIYFSDKPMRRDLDRVSARRPIVLYHSNLHLITVNSAALAQAGITRDNRVEGVYVDADDEPNGELAEVAAMFPVFRAVGDPLLANPCDADDLRRFGRACHRAGITTVADLYNYLDDEGLRVMAETTAEAGYPVRIAAALATTPYSVAQLRDRLGQVSDRGHARLHLGAVKIISDGSIQGFSARVRQPYVNGIENGVWYEAPPRIRDLIHALHEAGVRLHVHVNGDEAAELVLQAFAEAVAASGPGPGHVLQHAQMMDREQLARARDLGLMVNFFANHTWYWGDQHRDATVGAEIAARMNPARTALDLGLDVAIHCDAPVTPLGPLFTMWCAVNRLTASGQVLGAGERITAAEALRAVTLAPAISLGLDARVGSISPGKLADFTILEQDPLATEPLRIRDIAIRGTLLGGVWQPAA